MRPTNPSGRRRWPLARMLAGVTVVLLAAFSGTWPRGEGSRGTGLFLVLDPTPGARVSQVYRPLAVYCGDVLGRELQVKVVGRSDEFLALAADATVMLCTDAVGLRVQGATTLAVGRRRAPRNLRPTSVLVSRVGAAGESRPWLEVPSRTVFGDSLSLVCLAPLCQDGNGARFPGGAAVGSDPYDHGAVLEAMRLGAFDHAVVREWAAEVFLASSGVDAAGWQVVPLTEPMPDIVLLADGQLSRQLLLTLGEAMVTLGRQSEATPASGLVAQAALAGLGLDGFNVLLDPDFAALRGRYGACWPSLAE